MQTLFPCPPPRTRGFTLTELMISLTVLGLTMAGVVTFTYQALNTYYYDAGRLLVNHDMRKFTGDMATDAVFSNFFRIYPNFATRTTTVAGVTTDAAVRDGQSGDFLVLAFTDTDAGSGVTTVSELIGYYRDPADPAHPDTSLGPVRRFDVRVNPAVIVGPTTNTGASPPVYTMYDLLNLYVPASTAHTNARVIQLAQGLSNGTLFYDFYDRSIMIKGQIQEQGNLVKKAVNTYNFTVSPRG
jgi:prepilin-type N-terminal cleavage/methylation domain-containing protein